MVTYLSKFSPNLYQKVKPLRDLLSTKNEWIWGAYQCEAFDTFKKELGSTPVLALYDPNKDIS